ncbi:MAG: type II secretion system F family protein [Planctomycetota bacterium]|nr:MAG: type II secretion system F family protein [Planctomycetota bacterium]
MDTKILIPLAIAGSITTGVWAVANLFFGEKESRTSERLKELQDPRRRRDGKADNNSMEGMLKAAAPTLSKAIAPTNELEQNQLKVDLANAGYSSPHAPMIFLSLKMICMVVFAVVGGGVGLILQGATTNALTTLVGVAGLGFYLPVIVMQVLISYRKEAIFLSMPDALDLLVVCVEAGLGLDAAMRRVNEELTETAKELCEEMSTCNMQLQMGRPRREVLHDLGIRTGVDDVKTLVAILIQAERFGSSIATALRVQSESMRTKRRQMAEEQAQKTGVKIIFPLVLFIFPGIFVVLVGPAAIMVVRQMLNEG